MIEFNQVSKRYPGGSDVLSQVSFGLAQGEMAFLTGCSGAGKSTLLRLIAMLERPNSGQITVNNLKLNQLTSNEIAGFRASLGITMQNSSLLNDSSVFNNVALPLLIGGESKTFIKKRVHASLDMVGLLDKARMLPLQLSGGEQQRVGIARSVVHKPALLLADEPTGNLDPGLSAEVMKIFENFNASGVSVLIATHDLSLIAAMRHRILTLRGGQLC